MEDLRAHPNTQAVIDAWRRLSNGETVEDGPAADDYPGLVGRLFVLSHVADSDYAFRRAGLALERLFGRQLAEHNFLSIWTEPDRRLVAAALTSACVERGPSLIHARGETLAGRKVELEFVLAPLPSRSGQVRRYLGLCQPITSETSLNGRPLRRLQAIAVYPPAPNLDPKIRLVSSR